jgi:hypothetical protein
MSERVSYRGRDLCCGLDKAAAAGGGAERQRPAVGSRRRHGPSSGHFSADHADLQLAEPKERRKGSERAQAQYDSCALAQ